MLAALNTLLLKAAVLAAPINPGAPEPPPGADNILTIIRWASWIGAAAGVLGIIITGILMVLFNRRGQGEEHGKSLAIIMIGCIVISSASAIVAIFLP
ncbi:hypothetical protein [Rothia mucilaginosa]|jgi:hypothetical protein|uniref:hypothetical protein n=1 Tax=Rothia mucilaginosa TaxID=43675 RepID=UPI0025E7A0F4|nr:hypothetical protein [Rothia mucilaginosa]